MYCVFSSYYIYIYTLCKHSMLTQRVKRGIQAAPSEKLLVFYPMCLKTSNNDNDLSQTVVSFSFVFLILTVFGGKMTPQCFRRIQHKKVHDCEGARCDRVKCEKLLKKLNSSWKLKSFPFISIFRKRHNNNNNNNNNNNLR